MLLLSLLPVTEVCCELDARDGWNDIGFHAALVVSHRSLQEIAANCRVSRNLPCTSMVSQTKAVACCCSVPEGLGRKMSSLREDSCHCASVVSGPRSGVSESNPATLPHPKADQVKAHLPNLVSFSVFVGLLQNKALHVLRACRDAPGQKREARHRRQQFPVMEESAVMRHVLSASLPKNLHVLDSPRLVFIQAAISLTLTSGCPSVLSGRTPVGPRRRVRAACIQAVSVGAIATYAAFRS